jgi:chromosome segregation ATPase
MMMLETLSEQIGNIDNKLSALSTEMSVRFNQVDQKIDDKIDELAAMTARGFAEVTANFQVVESRLDVLENKVDVIENKIDVVEEKIDIIEENYATKDDLMTLEEHFESRFIVA